VSMAQRTILTSQRGAAPTRMTADGRLRDYGMARKRPPTPHVHHTDDEAWYLDQIACTCALSLTLIG